ncbi:hypothetical protein [Rhodoferax sp. TS-BS-61-7]|uniref:recombination directionality factor n=1 Tax=Rhodoferax sp. TS-BS-61-7 TaxID=2094194 RepID=UPI000CF723B9|nr:hypothetical protein [Rhodoferax sp. TS-BS-61-7]PQA79543.1 hypothetical protein C5F53_04670 [Rhodoferax sp. TS-BS-61-7]
MLKGLAITPPIVGRISIGKVVEKGGRRLPEKDDEFTITTQVQTKDGWMLHPLNLSLRKEGDANNKLRSIPVRVMFNDPDLNLRASYHYFDRQSGRPLCVGNGDSCKRSTVDGIQELPCPGPDGCQMGQGGNCKPYGRLNVLIGDEDELGSFIFRTTGHNSIRTLAARLKYFHAISGGRLATLPMELKLRGKSTAQSHRAPIYYVDLTIRVGMGMAEAVTEARRLDEARQAAGIDQSGLDEAARLGFAAGAFEESAEEGGAVLEEFYPPADTVGVDGGEPAEGAQGTVLRSGQDTLSQKLDRKVFNSVATRPAKSLSRPS